MKPPRYYIAKARLAGIFSGLPSGLVLILAALLAIFFAQDNLTPASVFVRAYTRSDGTRVSSYYRRPPGSVPHDQPYEVLRFAGIVALALGGYIAGKPLWRFFRWCPEALLPALGDAPAPPSPPAKVANPIHSARARRTWWCSACDATIEKGATYRYAEAVRTSAVRQRYCEWCGAGLVAEHKLERQRQREYAVVLARYGAVIDWLKRKQYLAVYGCEPETRPNKGEEPPYHS
jgi:hypothetical protein